MPKAPIPPDNIRNPPSKHYTHFVRNDANSISEVDFYYGPRYIGGKEGPWGRSDFLWTTLGNNTYKRDPADYHIEREEPLDEYVPPRFWVDPRWDYHHL
ncbi:hypothetical protein AA309_30020 [Microvirga vignae]|uniref:Uncharacterized protein n=1 Tax=Microvirga vignae TaxID=1225564 RepID=A0A0H1R393_9HYPH|nr:hypothetical protein [Microvirga vignae]KLK89680.1 hypothetical protein AA309_30020 [Microvirga vignae]